MTDTPHKAEGFTPQIRALCLERCAAYGDPPCWRLPDLIDLREPSHLFEPCTDCLTGKAVSYEVL